jgi:hypothetical protein
MLMRMLSLSILVLVLGLSARAAASEESDGPGHVLDLSGGVGFTFTTEADHKGQGTGGFFDAEYVFLPGSFFTPRLYAGSFMTFSNSRSCRTGPCEVKSQIFFAGAKARVMIPIPYVAPFLELGVGFSLGYLVTVDEPDVDERTRGAALHIPVTVGLAVGARHQFDIELSYLFHPSQRQVEGGIGFGIGIPLP